ncbi:MAG TPA: PPOX class F420-dependent oxidoreductase [Euzebyales bacterium]|nr:PPOX class F420-dependent oxidoreductase [Euzebyales bacterium]
MPPLSEADARAFLAGRHQGVLATIKRSDGRPQLSNVAYAVIGGRVRVSVTAGRAKTGNLRADPRVSLYVTSDDFWTYVVAEGVAELSPVARTPGDRTCRRLLETYEAASGQQHPDPDEFFAAMVADERLEIAFGIDHVYPVTSEAATR